jgi:hypothetical protein
MNEQSTTVTYSPYRWMAGPLVGLLLLGPVLTHLALAQADGIFDYTAVTQNEAARQGTVTAAGISWQCRGSRCTVSGPWPKPGVMACRALAQQVGPITSYGHPGASLNTADLAQCNDSAAAGPNTQSKDAIDSTDRDKVPPIENKNLTPGPISGPKAETLPDSPLAVLETARSTGLLRTARQTWHCEGTRCTIPRREGPLSGGGSGIDDCSRLAQAGGRITWFTDGREPFDAEKLARCNSPYVRSFEVFACSGADDLRDASHLTIGVYIRDRNFGDGNYRRIMSSGIPSNTCQFEYIDGPDFRVSELVTIYLRFQSYDSGLYQSDDNWDMTRFTIIANVTEPGGHPAILRIVDERRSLVNRFASPSSWHIDINRR